MGTFGFGLDIGVHILKFSGTDWIWSLWKNFGSNPIAKFLYPCTTGGSCPRWQLSRVAVVLGGSCPRWQLSGGCCPGGSFLGGSYPDTIFYMCRPALLSRLCCILVSLLVWYLTRYGYA